jgi:hypothetical protein
MWERDDKWADDRDIHEDEQEKLWLRLSLWSVEEGG